MGPGDQLDFNTPPDDDPVPSRREPKTPTPTPTAPRTSPSFAGGHHVALPLILAPGEVVADRYRVECIIGQGGMGTVYEVEHLFMKKRFALKVLSSLSDSSVRRFQVEAKAASRLDHPNLLKVYDFGLLAGQHPYLLMDLEHGVPLSAVIKVSTLSYNAVLNIFRQICSGLSYAHSTGVIHRDMKPSNIVVTKQEDLEHTDIVIVDFGIAKLTTHTSAGNELTRTGEPIGTPYYMSPEQCMGQAVDHRSDIYSVGCVLFECLVGTPPFLAESPLATMLMHQGTEPPSLTQATMGASFPPGLQLVMNKLLEKKPENRYQNLLDLEMELERIKAGEPPRLGVDAITKVSPDRKSRWDLIAIGAIAVVTSMLSIILLINWPKPATRTSDLDVKNPFELGNELIKDGEKSHSLMASSESKQESDALRSLTERKTMFSSPLPDNPSSRLFGFPDDPRLTLADLTVKGGNARAFIKRHGDFISMPGTMQAGSPVYFTDLSARGTFLVQNFNGLAIRPTQLLCNHPELFDLFRPDDITEFSVNKFAYEWKDNDLRCLKRFTNITDLELEYADNLTDEALNVISSKQRLHKLFLYRGQISDKALSKFSAIRRIPEVELGALRDPNIILNVLKGSPNTQLLGLEGCKFTKEDAELVATLPSLVNLHIESTNTLTADEIAPLTQKRLDALLLARLKLTPEVISILKSMHLKFLKAQFTKSECDRLTQILRPTTVVTAGVPRTD